MLSVSDLYVYYGRIPALQGVSLEVPAGKLVAVLGSNGAGKTSLLRAISGVLGRTTGSILFDGQAVERIHSSRRVNMGIVHVPEGRRIFPELTVAENLRMGDGGRKSGNDSGSRPVRSNTWTVQSRQIGRTDDHGGADQPHKAQYASAGREFQP